MDMNDDERTKQDEELARSILEQEMLQEAMERSSREMQEQQLPPKSQQQIRRVQGLAPNRTATANSTGRIGSTPTAIPPCEGMVVVGAEDPNKANNFNNNNIENHSLESSRHFQEQELALLTYAMAQSSINQEGPSPPNHHHQHDQHEQQQTEQQH